MAKYRLAREAEADLYRIWHYGARQWGIAAADDHHRALHERFEAIAANPLQYPAVDHIRAGYRRSVLGRNSIYFRVEGETPEIMAIIGQQNLDDWL